LTFDRERLKIWDATPLYNFMRKIAFPSMALVLTGVFAVSIIGGSLAFSIHGFSSQAIFRGAIFGLLVLAVPSVVSDLILHFTFLRDDPLYPLRRWFALSLFSCFLWILLLLVLAPIGAVYGGKAFPEYVYFSGFFVVLPFRFLLVLSVSSVRLAWRFICSISQPLASFMAATAFFAGTLAVTGVSLFVISTLTSFTSIYALIAYVESRGKVKIGFSPVEMFRAFLQDWLDGNSEPFEDSLEKLGVYQQISTGLLGFSSRRTGKLKGVMVVSNFHPGPLLNIGSSVLPHLIQRSLEEKFGVVASVPHGVSGHELNLVSQAQNRRVIQEVISLMDFKDFSSESSHFARSEFGVAKSSCQVFGDCALVTLTFSPNTMEDIPLDVGAELEALGKRHFSNMALIDAHNSITDISEITDDEVRDLKESFRNALADATSKPKVPFKIGVSKVGLDEFGLRQGIGPGGVVVFLIGVEDKLSAYITIDGNNMKSGFREKILDALYGLGIDQGEVMTTDTHMVNGVVTAKLGYHPIGEAVDQDKLIEQIKLAVVRARENLEEGGFAYSTSRLKVKTMGLRTNILVEFLTKMSRRIVFVFTFTVAVPTILCLAL